jgi:hypothetical protein
MDYDNNIPFLPGEECVHCGGSTMKFKSVKSQTDHKTSGLCEKCQKKTYTKDPFSIGDENE